MRERWERLLRWLFRPFVFHPTEICNHRDAVKEILGAQEANVAAIQVFVRAELERQAQIIFSAQGAMQEECARAMDEVKKMQAHNDDRFSQMLSLYHGKTPREWGGPLPRGPKQFTIQERQQSRWGSFSPSTNSCAGYLAMSRLRLAITKPVPTWVWPACSVRFAVSTSV